MLLPNDVLPYGSVEILGNLSILPKFGDVKEASDLRPKTCGDLDGGCMSGAFAADNLLFFFFLLFLLALALACKVFR